MPCMKKLIAVCLLVLMMFLSLTGASAESLLGGWQIAEESAITEERQALLDQALEGLVGVNYVPIAYLGSQVVAGTNHCFLCKATVVYPDAKPTLVLMYLDEDLNGNVEILQIQDLVLGPVFEPDLQ